MVLVLVGLRLYTPYGPIYLPDAPLATGNGDHTGRTVNSETCITSFNPSPFVSLNNVRIAICKCNEAVIIGRNDA